MNFKKQLREGLLTNNPVVGQLLGMCSTMAITTTLFNGLGMGLSVTLILICSNVVISLLRKVIPDKIRIAAYIVVIAGFVTIIDLLLQAYLPALSESLGVFIPLIVVNCIILGRAEAFASKNGVLASAVDGLTQGIGYTVALVCMCVIRELLGSGTFGKGVISADGVRILPSQYPAMLMILPVGGFLTLACLIAFTQWFNRHLAEKGMPQEDHSQDTLVTEFEAQHKSEGIGLELKELNYAYHTGTKVFLNANLNAYPHEIIALVGPSGEGKTTMLRLLLSLLKPQNGELSVCSGANFSKKISLSPSTRKLFSYVPQGNTMFSGTIAENMRIVKPEATDAEIIEALKLACAWEFVAKLPDGIQSEIKERGGGLSEGQAQRLSIARALLRKSPILLLDEATSALDVATERNVLKNIMQDTYPRTCIVTTHRPTVLNICTRVYAIREKKCECLAESEIQKLIAEF